MEKEKIMRVCCEAEIENYYKWGESGYKGENCAFLCL